METRRFIIAALSMAGFATSALAETTVIRPGPCAAQSTYLLAANSGALIRVEPELDAGRNEHIIVFRYQPTTGWASQRLLKRFDLELEDGGARIMNSGVFCTGAS